MPEEDRKSVGTEGTDVEVEEPFSPSATTKDKESFGLELDKYRSASPVSHSPPEPISPSRERALSEDLSPVYDSAQDPRKMKIAVGLSPSEFISEYDKILEEEEEEEEEAEETVEEPTVGLSPSSETTSPTVEEHVALDLTKQESFKTTTQGDDKTSVEEEGVTADMASVKLSHQETTEQTIHTDTAISAQEAPQDTQNVQTLEFMSFDNMAFAGKDRIDVDEIRRDQRKVIIEQTEQVIKEEKTDVAKPDGEDYEKRSQQDSHLDMDMSSTESSEPGRECVPESIVQKETSKEKASEPHESIEKAYEAQVIDTIMERCSHEFEPSSELQMEPTSFRIGQIEYQQAGEAGKQISDPAAEIESCKATETQADEPDVAQTSSESDEMTASAMTSSFITAITSLDASDQRSADTQISNIQPDMEVPQVVQSAEVSEIPEILQVIHESRQSGEIPIVTAEASLDQTESASLDSEDLDEPYGDQKAEMVAECQVDLAPSPLPPHVSHIEQEYDDEEGNDNEDEDEDEEDLERDTLHQKQDSPVLVAEASAKIKHIEICTPKPVESISSEELVKTSSSSDTSAEPTILAATYDLDSGAISRVVADYDISPDTVEKTLTVDSQPKAILSSPEDEVFESELGEYKSKSKEVKDESADIHFVSTSPTKFQETIIEEPESESSSEGTAVKSVKEQDRPSSPFELVGKDDLEGYEEFVAASFQFQGFETEKQKPSFEFEDVAFGVGVGITAAAGAAAFAESTETDKSKVPEGIPTVKEKHGIPAMSSFGEQEESPTFEHSSPISSSEPSDFRGPISPFDTPAVEPLPEISPVVDDEEHKPTVGLEEIRDEESPDEYIHANGPTEVDYYPEHEAPYMPMQQIGVADAEQEESDQEAVPAEPARIVEADVAERSLESQEESEYQQEEDYLLVGDRAVDTDIVEHVGEEKPEDFAICDVISMTEEEQVGEDSPQKKDTEEEEKSQDSVIDSDTDPLRPEASIGTFKTELDEAGFIGDESFTTVESVSGSMVESRSEDLLQESLTTSTELITHASESTLPIGKISVPVGTSETSTTTTNASFRDYTEDLLLSQSQKEMTISADQLETEVDQTGLTESLMESLLHIPEDVDKMMTSDQTLYNIEMPTEELSASQSSHRRDFGLPELSSLEEEIADATRSMTEYDVFESTSQALEEPQLLDRPPSSGKEALESDAMYTLFSDTVVTEVPPDYAHQSIEVEDDVRKDYQTDDVEDGAFSTGPSTQIQLEEPQPEDGGDSLMECDDEELAALADYTELDQPTTTEFAPVERHVKQIDEYPAEIMDIELERPQSPVPDESERYLDETPVEQEMDVDEGDHSPIRELLMKEEDLPSSSQVDALEAHASRFVENVMVEAQATVQIDDMPVDADIDEAQEESMSESDKAEILESHLPEKLSVDIFAKRDKDAESSSSGEEDSGEELPPPPSPPHILEQFLPKSEQLDSPDDYEPALPSERAPEPPAEDDIPAITITQHLHKETDEGDYPTSYAPAVSEPEESAKEVKEVTVEDVDFKKSVKPLGEFDSMFDDSAEVLVKVKLDEDASPLSPDTDSFLGKGPDLKSPKETKAGIVSSESEDDLLLDSPELEIHVVRVEEIQHGRVEKPLPVLPEESPSKEKYEEELMRQEEILKEQEGDQDSTESDDQDGKSPDKVSELAAAVVHGVIEAVKSDSSSFLGVQQTTHVSGLRTEGFDVNFDLMGESEDRQGVVLDQADSKSDELADEKPELDDKHIISSAALREEEHKTPEHGSPDHDETSSEMTSSGEGQVSVISLDSAVRQRESIDLQSPEDLGDSSSVDSFATVIATQQETLEGFEDRMAEVASMTSSFHSDMQSSFHEDVPEAAIAIDVRDKEADASKLSSSSSGEMFDLEAAVLGMSQSPPDDDHYEVLHLMTGLEYPRLPRQLEVVKEEPESDQKDSSGETTSSSSERLGVVATDSSSERLYSSPDIPAPSPDIHGGRFFNKSNERDDVSVSSSLLEFERLEMEIGDKTSLDSFKVDFDSPQPMYSRSLEKDDASVSSSLAEFEQFENVIGQSDSLEKVTVTPDGKNSLDNASVCSLHEFEKLEEDFRNESDTERKRRLSSSSDSNPECGPDSSSIKSSTSSLTEFEQLEQEMYVNEDLEVEAQRVVSLLESGALVPDLRSESDMSLSDVNSQKEFISQEELVELDDIPRDEPSSDEQMVSHIRDTEEDMDRDSLGDAEETRDIDRIIMEASRNVETFAAPTEAVLVSRTLQEVIRTATCESHTRTGLIDYGTEDAGAEADVDSLDGHDDEVYKKDQATVVVPIIVPSIVPAEQTTHEIDADSLQGDSESQSRSGALDSDSLQDQDSVMQISAESFEMDPHGPTMSSSAEGDRMLRSSDSGAGVMERSADSLELDRATAAPVILRPTEGQMTQPGGEGLMERSADSLEEDPTMPQSDSKDSFDCDSLHDDDEGEMVASAEWPGELEPPRPRRHADLMELSMESGAWSQSSSLFSQSTMKSSASEAYKDIMRMSVDSPEYNKRTIIDMPEHSTERFSITKTVEGEINVHHAQSEKTETDISRALVDSEGNVHSTQTFELKCSEDKSNVRSVSLSEEHEQMDVDSEWSETYKRVTTDQGDKRDTSVGHLSTTTSDDRFLVGTQGSTPPLTIPHTAPPFPSAQSSPSSESSHSENCYCGPDLTSSMELGPRPDQQEHPLTSRGSTNHVLFVCCMCYYYSSDYCMAFCINR